VRVAKTDLLEKLTQNRDKHATEYAAALEKWNALILKRTREALELAEAGTEYRTVVLVESDQAVAPEDHTGQYDDTIALLNASQDDVFILKVHDFQRYYLDKWPWAERNALSISNSIKASSSRSY
jgi:hypothetical protein